MFNRLFQPKIAALLALLGYGLWAGYCNADFGTLTAARAFAVQGLYAWTTTLLLGTLAGTLLLRFGATAGGALISYSCCLLLMGLIPWSLHSLAGTPNILISIVPGLLLGNLYLIGLLWTQYRNAPGQQR